MAKQRLSSEGIRIRGRKGQWLRRRRLAREPLCRICKSKGLVVEATVPDHILPLAKGGTDTDDNIRCLCDHCHLDVTREQFGVMVIGADVDGWPKL